MLANSMLYRISFFLLLTFSASFGHGHGLVHEQIDEISTLIETSKQSSDEKRAKLYIRRGRLYIEDERLRLAKSDFKRALKTDKQALDALYYLADVALKREKYSRAIKQAKKFLAVLPEESSARMRGYHILGQAFYAARKYDKATQAFEQTIAEAVVPKPEYYLDLAKSHLALDKAKLAIEALEAGKQRRGNLSVFDDTIVQIYIDQEQYEQALQHLNGMIENGQRLPFLYLKKADVWQLMQQDKSAREALTMALEQLQALPAARQQAPALQELKQEIQKRLN